MRDILTLWTPARRVLVLLLVLVFSVACANTGEDDPDLGPPAQSPPAQQTPIEVPSNFALTGCCRLCIRGIVCGDVCLDPDLARCATGTPAGCACQGG